jgi:hypothetical protein
MGSKVASDTFAYFGAGYYVNFLNHLIIQQQGGNISNSDAMDEIEDYDDD